jgi:hypothetical protein
VANLEGETPNSDDLKTPGEEPQAMHPEIVEAAEAEPVAVAAPVEEVEEPAKLPDGRSPRLRDEEKGPSKLPVYLPIACAICLPIIALAFAFLGNLYYSTAIYIIALGYIPLALWASRRTNTVFVVFLGCVLAAVLTAVYCLWMEIGQYNYDIKAQEAKQKTVSLVWPVQERGGGESC